MEQSEFLENKIFADLENVNNGFDKETIHYFSESDFEMVLQRVQHFGLGIYEIKPWIDGEIPASAHHEDYKKKATDPQWYKKAFLTFKTRQPGLLYSASYRVSPKLLAR